MIYRATWQDGRQLIFRADDENDARESAGGWRVFEPFNDQDINPEVFRLEYLEPEGKAENLLSGWTPYQEVERG